MARSVLDVAFAFAAVAAFYGLAVGLVVHQLRKARRAAESLGLQRSADDRWWKPRYEGWLEGRALTLRLVSTDLGKRRFIAFETTCTTPPGFTLILGDRGVAKKCGVRLHAPRVATGWRNFDGWADPRASEAARDVSMAFLRAVRRELNGAPVQALWFHEGRAGIAENVTFFKLKDALPLVQALGKRCTELEQLAEDPERVRALTGAPAVPEEFGPPEEAAAS